MTSPGRGATVASGAAGTALIDRFTDRAGKLGVKIHRVATLDEVAILVAGLTASAGAEEPAGRVVIGPRLDGTQPALRRQITARGIEVGTVDPANPAATFAGVTVGVSDAVLGVAETGSLVVADALPDRLVRMLSPTHVVVLGAAWIVPGLDEAGTLLHQLVSGDGGARAGYVSFVTGPSRTADIEMSLTVGAHGPAELHIAILGAAQV